MKKGAILKIDSRDRHAHVRFGQIMGFQPESNFGFDLYKVVEPETAVSCTAFTTTKVRGSQTKVQYDVDDLWSKVTHGSEGADPRDTLGTAIKQGLKDFSDPNRDFGLKGYYRADTGVLAPHDNARSAMTLNQSSLMINTYWYKEWNDTPIFGIMPVGKTKVSAHSYVIVDWKIINGQTVFLIDSHQGQKRYMPFDVFDQALLESGTSTFMPSTQEVLDQRNKTIWESISDGIKNAWILLSKIQVAINAWKNPPIPLTETKPKDDYQEVKEAIQPPKVPSFFLDKLKDTMIEKWANIIADLEGADPRLNNPGNLKYAPLIASWGATKAKGSNFAQFTTSEQGMSALCGFLTLACKNELIPYHNARTIKQFTLVYTNFPKPAYDYSDTLIKRLGVTPDTQISTFLTS